jgi:hypothetical protein
MAIYASWARAIGDDMVMAFGSDGTSTVRFKLLAFGRALPSPYDACMRT